MVSFVPVPYTYANWLKFNALLSFCYGFSYACNLISQPHPPLAVDSEADTNPDSGSEVTHPEPTLISTFPHDSNDTSPTQVLRPYPLANHFQSTSPILSSHIDSIAGTSFPVNSAPMGSISPTNPMTMMHIDDDLSISDEVVICPNV